MIEKADGVAVEREYRGYYVQGLGKAHENSSVYREYFGCDMIGTFNVRCPDLPSVDEIPCTFSRQHPTIPGMTKFWLVLLNGHYPAWVTKWPGSKMRDLEIISKRELPYELKNRREGISVEFLNRWGAHRIQKFCDENYVNRWHQTFPWSPQLVESELIWDTIRPHADWRNKDVLDIGCAWGYHSIQASKAGAHVLGIDANPDCIDTARLINNHIEQSDVSFARVEEYESRAFKVDIILYLSVHHQPDPEYKLLAIKVAELRARAREKLFLELIRPPAFGKTLAPDFDGYMERLGGTLLHTYAHKVRGPRSIYMFDGPGQDV